MEDSSELFKFKHFANKKETCAKMDAPFKVIPGEAGFRTDCFKI